MTEKAVWIFNLLSQIFTYAVSHVIVIFLDHRMPAPAPLPLPVVKAGRNNLNKEITEIGERYSQTISNLGYAAFLRLCELPQ